eukprot:gene56294-77164_t
MIVYGGVEELRSLVKVRNVWSPNMTSSVREDLVTNWRRALARSFGWLVTALPSPAAAAAAAAAAQEDTTGKGSNVDDTLIRSSRRGDDSMYVWWLLVGAGFAAGIAA